MTAREFDGIEILLIDGNNLLHRVSGSIEPGAQRLLIARLRGAIPDTMATVMMLDGHAASGTKRNEKVTKGFEIRHSGNFSADESLLRLIHDTPINERHQITLVSDDRPLLDKTRGMGARTQRLQWLEQILNKPPSGATTAPGAAIGTGPGPSTFEQPERRPWTPGRGATQKRGNPKRRG